MKRGWLSRARAPAAVAVVLFVYGIAGCSRNPSPPTGSQAGPKSSAAPYGLETIPLYPRSDPLGPRGQRGDAVEQTFEVLGATPQEVLDWYGDQLSDWIALPAKAADRAASLRRTWVSGSRRLVIAAAPSTEVGADSPYATEYSVTLDERGAVGSIPEA